MTGTLTGLTDTLANFRPPVPRGPGADGLAAGFDHDSAGWERVVNQLLDIRGLRPGWDGEEAPAPGTALTDSALRLVNKLRRRGDCPPPGRAVASFDGTVVLEWQWAGALVELEVTAPDQGDVVFHRRGHPTRHAPTSW